MTTTNPTPNRRNQDAITMWPFSDMSLEIATRIGNIAKFVLLSSLVFGVASTYFIVMTANVKEGRWDEEKTFSQERVAEAGKVAAQATAVAALAEKGSAEAKVVAETLRLEIARLSTPRRLSVQQAQIIINELSSVPKGNLTVGLQALSQGDIGQYATEIWNALLQSGFDIPNEKFLRLFSYPGTGLRVEFPDEAEPRRLADAVHAAFLKAGITIDQVVNATRPSGQAVILVGPRF